MTREQYQSIEASSKCRSEVNAQINETKINIKEMGEEIKEIKESQIKQGEEMKYMRITMNSLDMKMDKFIESADQKFASKLTETLVYGVASVMLLAVVGGLITLIIK